jgi:hypothetical protein
MRSRKCAKYSPLSVSSSTIDNCRWFCIRVTCALRLFVKCVRLAGQCLPEIVAYLRLYCVIDHYENEQYAAADADQ